MAKHDVGTATVNDLASAKTGDTLWLYESQSSLHDEAGKYLGRGVWRLVKIEGETRVSFTVWSEKFDRATGRARPRNGYTSGNFLAGEVEKVDTLWLSSNRHRLIQHLGRCDATTLRKIADLVGWQPALAEER